MRVLIGGENGRPALLVSRSLTRLGEGKRTSEVRQSMRVRHVVDVAAVLELEPALDALSAAGDGLDADGAHARLVVGHALGEPRRVEVERVARLVPLGALGRLHHRDVLLAANLGQLVAGRGEARVVEVVRDAPEPVHVRLGTERGREREGAVEAREGGEIGRAHV